MGEDVVEIPVKLSTEGFKKGSKEVQSAVKSMGESTKTFGNAAKNSISGFKKGFKEAGDATKKFGTIAKSAIKTIVGVGAAYQIISKAISAYMAENKKLSQQINGIWTALGNLLGPIIEKIIGIVTSAVSYLLGFLKLLGVTTKSASQLSKSAKGAGGAIKASLAGFDELNKLQDSSGGGAAGLADKDPTEWMNKIAELLKGKMWEEAGKEIAAKLNALVANIDFTGLGEKIGKGLGGALKVIATVLREFKFSELGKKLGQGLTKLISNIDWKDVGAIFMAKLTWLLEFLVGLFVGMDWGEVFKAIAEFVKGAVEYLTKKIQTIDWKEVGQKISKAIKDLFDPDKVDLKGILEAIGELASTIWNAFLDILSGALGGEGGEEPPIVTSLRSLGESIGELCDTISSRWEEIQPILQDIYEKYVEPALDWLLNEALPWLIDRITEVVDFISEHGPEIEAILLAIAAGIAAFKLVELFQNLGSICTLVSGKLIGGIKAVWGLLAANPIALLIAAIVALVVLIATKGDEIKAVIQKVDDWLQGVFAKDWTEIFGPVLGNVLNGFFNTLKGVWDSIKLIFDGIIDFIRGVFTGDWERAWTGVKEIFAGIAKSLVTVFKAPLNGIISLINGAIGGLNSLIDKINSGVGKTLGFTLGHIGTIPLLARGGVLKKGQLGFLEGDGAEAVVPLEKNTEWIGKVADGFVDRLSSNQGIAKGIAALSAIGDSVAFKMPAVAAGTVTPYSVAAASVSGSSTGSDSEILRLIERLYELLERFVSGMDNMQFVAEFEDLRALAKRITKEQRRQMISEDA